MPVRGNIASDKRSKVITISKKKNKKGLKAAMTMRGKKALGRRAKNEGKNIVMCGFSDLRVCNACVCLCLKEVKEEKEGLV